MEFPHPLHENDRLPRMRGKHEGARCCYAGPPDHCASCKMTRASPSPHPFQCRPYVFEGVDEGGRWYNGGKRTDERRGLSVPHVWTSQHNGNPFFGVRRTDGRTDRSDDVWTPPWKSPVRVRLRNKTTAASARRWQRDRQNNVTLDAWPSLVLFEGGGRVLSKTECANFRKWHLMIFWKSSAIYRSRKSIRHLSWHDMLNNNLSLSSGLQKTQYYKFQQ